MNASHFIGRLAMPGWVMGRTDILRGDDGGLRVPLMELDAGRRSHAETGAMRCILCLALWLSLLLAMWMSKGWIGLLFSGQLLSAGAWMFQKLARRTQFVFRGLFGVAQ
jgi:hypothetical protein